MPSSWQHFQILVIWNDSFEYNMRTWFTFLHRIKRSMDYKYKLTSTSENDYTLT